MLLGEDDDDFRNQNINRFDHRTSVTLLEVTVTTPYK